MDEIGGDDSPESIGGESVAELPAEPRSQKPQRVELDGGPRVFVILAGPAGLWAGLGDDARARQSWPQLSANCALLVGVVLAKAFELVPVGAPAKDGPHERMRELSARKTKARHVFGYVEHPVLESAETQQPPQLQMPVTAACLVQCAALGVSITPKTEGEHDSGTNLGDMVKLWGKRCKRPPTFVLMAFGAAQGIVKGIWHCIHSVPITKKIARKQLLVPSEPHARHLKGFIADVKETGEDAGQAHLRTPKWAALLKEPDLVLDWLRATEHLKGLRHAQSTAYAYGKLFARCSRISPSRLMGDLEYVRYETLRVARLRLDAVAMLIFRRFWAKTVTAAASQEGNVSLYLFCDASPTWRGVELWASSFDLFDGSGFLRRLFPCVALKGDLLDSSGKTFALLWQIFLVAGPDFERVRQFCSRVRAVVTDMGVERKICDMPDVLGDFYSILQPGFVPPSGPMQHLWPRALAVPGWKHQVDLLIRHGLTSMAFFPKWLQRLKALNSFLRADMYSQTLGKALRAVGHVGLAEAVGAVRLPTFAEWRWGTLHTCLKGLLPFLDSLIAHFDPSPFERSREQANMSLIVGALRSPEWRLQCDFVFWFTEWLTHLMEWGCGCACHEVQLRQGADIDCPRKGRRLHEAHMHLTAEMRRALDTANSWTVETWGCGPDFLAQAQGCVRLVYAMGGEKFEFLSKLPYLLAQLHLPGVRDRALEQWRSAPPAAHHRVSREFLADGSPLRAQIERMNSDGSGMAPALKAEVESLRAIPLDDSVAEGPHAKAKRVQAHARGSRFPWVASTMRLSQNLEDATDMLDATDSELLPLWCAWKSVIRCGGRRQLQNKRMGMRSFTDHLYRLSFCNGPPAGRSKAGPGVAEELDEQEEAEATEEVEAGGERPTPAKAKVVSRRPRLAHGDQSASSTAAKLSTRPLPDSARGSAAAAEMQLMRQWLAASLAQYSYISVPVDNGDEALDYAFFQVLSLERRTLQLKTFEAEQGGREGELLYSITVQPLERWRAPALADKSAPSREAEVFVYFEPTKIDILRLASGGVDNRQLWRGWTPVASDVDGCTALHSPCPIAHNMMLSHPKVLVLSLVDALHESGFSPIAQKTTHIPGAPKVYDNRHLPSKRFYLQAVLAIDDLATAGVKGFESGRPGVYYKVLLKTKRLPDPSLSLKALQQLAVDDDSFVELAALGQAAPIPAPKRQGSKRPAPVARADDGESIGGDSDEGPPPGEPSPLSPADGASDDEIAGESPEEPAHPPPPVAAQQRPREILGQTVTYVRGRADARWLYHDRLSVKCNNPDHIQCKRSRSMELDRDVFGERAAEAFLGAWLLKSHLSQSRHKKWAPTRAEMREFLAAH